MSPWLFLTFGLFLLVAGAESLVRGAARLAASLGVSPLVIGLTVVAYGTSAPELAVSLQAGLRGNPGLALGNVVGSNIFNILVILGLSALVIPLTVDRALVRREVPVLIGVSVLVMILGLDGRIGRPEGAILTAGGLLYTLFLVRGGRRAGGRQADMKSTPRPRPGRVTLDLLRIALGLAALVLGASWLVGAATYLARGFGVSDLVIGLTIVAAGTSLPELATSVIAGLKGERDIAVGNVVGSNLFNLLIVLGSTAAVVPGGVEVPEGARGFDLPVMTAVAIACLPIFFTGHRVDRWEGAIFLGYFGAYLGYLWLSAERHPWLPGFRDAMLYFALPLTLITLGILVYRAARRR